MSVISPHGLAYAVATHCTYCAQPFGPERRKTRDHVVPRQMRRLDPDAFHAAGGDGWRNVVAACQPCNGLRAALGHDVHALLEHVRQGYQAPSKRPRRHAEARAINRRWGKVLSTVITEGPEDLADETRRAWRAWWRLYPAQAMEPEAQALLPVLERAEAFFAARVAERKAAKAARSAEIRLEIEAQRAALRRAKALRRAGVWRLDEAPEPLAFPCPDLPPISQMAAAPR